MKRSVLAVDNSLLLGGADVSEDLVDLFTSNIVKPGQVVIGAADGKLQVGACVAE